MHCQKALTGWLLFTDGIHGHALQEQQGLIMLCYAHTVYGTCTWTCSTEQKGLIVFRYARRHFAKVYSHCVWTTSESTRHL